MRNLPDKLTHVSFSAGTGHCGATRSNTCIKDSRISVHLVSEVTWTRLYACVYLCVCLYRHVHALVSQQFISSVRQLVKNRCCVCTQSVRRFLLPKQCRKTGMWLTTGWPRQSFRLISCLLTKFLSCNMQLMPPFSASQYSNNIKDPKSQDIYGGKCQLCTLMVTWVYVTYHSLMLKTHSTFGCYWIALVEQIWCG